MVSAPSSQGRLNALQGLRALAAMLVVCDHGIDNMVKNAGATIGTDFAHFLGQAGVQIFFVISGFVMILAHGDDFGRPLAWRGFYARRIGRIVPIYWLITLVYAAYLAYDQRGPSLIAIVKSLFFVPFANSEGFGHPVLGQGWTLNYEAFFYLVFGLALLVRGGAWLVFAFFGALVAAGAAGLLGASTPIGFLAAPVVLYFMAGMAIGLLRPHLSWGPDFGTALVLAVGFVLADIAVAAILGVASPMARLVAPLATVCTVATCAWARETPGASSAPQLLCAMLGAASYSLYMTHTLVLGPLSKALARAAAYGFAGPLWLVVAMMVVICSLIGVAIYEGVEKRLVKTWARVFYARPARQILT